VLVTKLFSPLPVRRKEFERNVKREFGKALSLLQAYALGPCSVNDGVRLTVTNQTDKGYVLPQLMYAHVLMTYQGRNPSSFKHRGNRC
jgi:DNA mismatch repair protein PMS2